MSDPLRDSCTECNCTVDPCAECGRPFCNEHLEECQDCYDQVCEDCWDDHGEEHDRDTPDEDYDEEEEDDEE